MKRLQAVIAVSLLLTVISGQVVLSQQFPFTSTQRETLAESVVFIFNRQRGDQGTGVIISPDGLIWTNEHLVDVGDRVEIRMYDGENRPPVTRYLAEVLETTSPLDFALLRIVSDVNGTVIISPNFQSVTATSANASQGDSVFLFGFPRIAEGVLNISPGFITAIPTRPYGQIYKSNAEFAPGASGSLAVNVDGVMIGIASEDREDDSGRLVDILPVSTICAQSQAACQTEGTNISSAETSQQILFASNREGPANLYSIGDDGTNIFRFIDLPDSVGNPKWSRQVNKLLFHANYDIYTVNWDGTDLTRLTQTRLDEYGNWSPDGRFITFHSWRDGDLEIYVMSSDGSNIRQLTFNSVDDGFPRWSPDGQRIVFQRDANADRGNSDIFIIDGDGTDEQRITNDMTWDWVPTWSPDGNQLAFMSFDGQDWEIYTMGINSLNKIQLTNNTIDDRDPDWSQDGRRIAFTTRRPSLPGDEGNEIAIMNADGTDLKILTNDRFADVQPSWR